MTDKNIKCLLCDSQKLEEIYKMDVEEIFSIIDNKNPEIKKELNKILNGRTVSFIKCTECNFAFANPFIGGTNKLYSLIYNDNYPTDRWEYGLAINEIKKSDKVLEIGSGNGFFLNKLSKSNDKNNLFSLEVSNESSDFKSINDIPNDSNFSVVCMFQVLEHLDNFKEVIEKITAITTDSAKLIISVPAQESSDFFRKKVGIGDTPPIHVSIWDKDSISKLDGWKIKEYHINILSKKQLFKNLFYGIRTKNYPGSRNPLKLLVCLAKAICLFEWKNLQESQYFYLIKDSENINNANNGGETNER